VSDVHVRPLVGHDLPEYIASGGVVWIDNTPIATARPRVWGKRLAWSGRTSWSWTMIHPVWPDTVVTHGPFWSCGEAGDDARRSLTTRAWS
jgi:hypothetical protein